MEASKHTPGPWSLFHHKDSGARYIDAGSVQMQISRTSDAGAEDMDANARLIASAPELLELVTAIMKARGKCYIPNNEDGLLSWDEKARAAIAKATGASHE